MILNKPRYYVYKLIHVEGYEYIGIRTCRCDPERDPYMGSGVRLKNFNTKDFNKIIIKETTSRKKALELEKTLVDADYVSNPKVLNVVRGGSGGGRTKGSKNSTSTDRMVEQLSHTANFYRLKELDERLSEAVSEKAICSQPGTYDWREKRYWHTEIQDIKRTIEMVKAGTHK